MKGSRAESEQNGELPAPLERGHEHGVGDPEEGHHEHDRHDDEVPGVEEHDVVEHLGPEPGPGLDLDVETEAEPSDDDPNRLDIKIKYRVMATNNTRNLVYPFYLRRSDD